MIFITIVLDSGNGRYNPPKTNRNRKGQIMKVKELKKILAKRTDLDELEIKIDFRDEFGGVCRDIEELVFTSDNVYIVAYHTLKAKSTHTQADHWDEKKY